MDAGPSREHEEEEVGNFRVSPHVDQKKKAENINSQVKFGASSPSLNETATNQPAKSKVEIEDQEEAKAAKESDSVPKPDTSKSS